MEFKRGLWKIQMALKTVVIWLSMLCKDHIEDKIIVRLVYFITFGRKICFDKPRTFNEHLCCRKIRDEELELAKYTDKYEVKKYVSASIGESYLNETLEVYNNVEQIDFSKLPQKFVLKCTHGSSFNIVVDNRKKLDVKKAKKQIKKWMKRNYYYVDREKNYKNITPRILCDKFLETPSGILDEYKLFCFYGKVRLIQHNIETPGERFANLYDETWNKLDVQYGYSGTKNDKVPILRNELIAVAEQLSKPFEFVRVDLYVVQEKIYFSELTFHSGGGYIPFNPATFDTYLGNFFE